MNQSTSITIRRIVSLAAFSALIAVISISFADRPNERTSITYKGERAIRFTPSSPVRLAEAPARKTKSVALPSPSKSKHQSASGLIGALNLNFATAEELMRLPGIGPKKAATIIQWREKRGNFKRVVDLRRVKGFGAKTVKRLKPYLTVSGKTTLE